MGVLTDYHWFVYVPLPTSRQRKVVLFISLPWHPFLPRCGCSLSIPHGMHWVVPTQPCFFGWSVIPAGKIPQKSLSKNRKIGFPFSPPPNHALLPLTYDLTMSHIGWVQAGGVWALCVPLFHVCPKSTCYSCVRHGLEACLYSLPSFFDLLCGLLYDSPLLLDVWALFDTGLYISFSIFLDFHHVLPYYSVILAVMTWFCWASLGLPFILSPVA